MGYIVMGLFALEPVAIEGANLQLINHGLSAAGLFALVGMIYERFHTRSIANLGGIATKAPWLTVLFMLFTFSSIGLPGLNGFVGEFLILAGSFQRAWAGVAESIRMPYLIMAVSAVAGVILGAWYMLWAVERVFFGGSREPPRQQAATHDHAHAAHDAHAPSHHDGHCDLQWHEVAALAPLAVFVFWIGLAPAAFLAPPAAMLRANTRGAATAFAEQMRTLEDLAPSTQPARIADRVVRRDQPAARQPFTLTSELTLDRP
jgi:NADH-quinone oxidoreductase subunit M